MTLYWGYCVSSNYYSNAFVATSATVGKIENVECIADSTSLANSKSINQNKFAIIKNNNAYKVIPLGCIKKIKDENGIIFYEGCKVFTNDKKTLLDYYRKGAVKFNNGAEKRVKKYDELDMSGDWYSTSGYYQRNAKAFRNKISLSNKVFKKLLDKIKAL